jgi:putative ABC transport system permease protein
MLVVKLRRDLRAAWSRLLLMVVAICVSLTVFGGVLYAWSVMARETADAYQSTEPASATILLDRPMPAAEMATLANDVRSRPGVIEATVRTQFTGDIRINGQPREVPLQVFVATPDDPMRMARFLVEDAAWPPKPGEVLVGRDSLALLNVAVGDRLAVETPGGEAIELRVVGTVYDPSLSPSPQEQTGRAYLSAASLPLSGQGVTLDQLKIQVADPGGSVPSRARNRVVAIASEVGEWLQGERGVLVREIQVPPPYAHPHQWQADALLGAMLAGGAAAVVLSAILVANMLNGMFTQQIPQIGIMKAIGARSSDIERLYLAMTLLVAGAATIAAIVPAVLIGRALVSNVFAFLGIRPASLDAPWWALGVIVVAGIGLPPLMALAPLIRTSRITVRAAIDHRGLGANPSGATGVLARLSRISRVDRGLVMALRNTIRRPARFLLSVGLLASAGTVFVSGVSLSAGVEAIEREQSVRRNWDVDVQLAAPTPLDEVTAALRGIADVELVEGLDSVPTGVAGAGRLPVTRTYPDQGHGRVSVTAVATGMTTFEIPSLLEGRWLDAGETGAVVLNQVARAGTVPDVRVDGTIQLLLGGKPTTWRVVGIVEERGGGSAVYATAEGLADALRRPPQVNQVRIVTTGHDEDSRTGVATAVDQTLAAAGIDVASSASISRREAISEGHLGPVITIVLAIAIAMGVIGTIGLASTMSTNVLDRTREFGVMHAIGARPERVRRIVGAEGVFIAIASVVLAIIPTIGLTAVLGAGLGDLFFSAPLPYRISVPAIAIWTAIAVLGSMLATEAAASRASHITVREALAYV